MWSCIAVLATCLNVVHARMIRGCAVELQHQDTLARAENRCSINHPLRHSLHFPLA